MEKLTAHTNQTKRRGLKGQNCHGNAKQRLTALETEIVQLQHIKEGCFAAPTTIVPHHIVFHPQHFCQMLSSYDKPEASSEFLLTRLWPKEATQQPFITQKNQQL